MIGIAINIVAFVIVALAVWVAFACVVGIVVGVIDAVTTPTPKTGLPAVESEWAYWKRKLKAGESIWSD